MNGHDASAPGLRGLATEETLGLPARLRFRSFGLLLLVAEKGGLVCTSANADKAFRWAWTKSARLRRCVVPR